MGPILLALALAANVDLGCTPIRVTASYSHRS